MSGAAARFEVLLTEGAKQDLESIHAYVTEFDCAANADEILNEVLNELMNLAESLSKLPERGSYPKELVNLGIKENRQSVFKP